MAKTYKKRGHKEAGILDYCFENKPTYARLKSEKKIIDPRNLRGSAITYGSDGESSTLPL